MLNNYLVTGLQLCLAPVAADEHRGVWDEDDGTRESLGVIGKSPWMLTPWILAFIL